ncbi:hypothetical protein [Hymenobacter lapidiphilus]|uniref:Lipoprotein n=1 Tax=Hymenobacter lapidiphilus TaxID=2608003 RepID=A0A7Y7PP41_9BACT|nr:hypothetical protein [Hymenobacter lapidiphilus]NVO31277.1 hypothetical protein [Hymenobacter lapidiphilus]
MKSVLTLLGGLLLTLAMSSCATREGEVENLQPCQSGPVAVTSLDKEYGCTSSRWINLSAGPAPVIIRSQAQFDQQATGECHPQIDFAKYDLVIGQQLQMNGGASASATYDYQLNCSDASRVLRVLLKPGVTLDLRTYTYHALVPKLGPAETVKVEVQVLPQ